MGLVPGCGEGIFVAFFPDLGQHFNGYLGPNETALADVGIAATMGLSPWDMSKVWGRWVPGASRKTAKKSRRVVCVHFDLNLRLSFI